MNKFNNIAKVLKKKLKIIFTIKRLATKMNKFNQKEFEWNVGCKTCSSIISFHYKLIYNFMHSQQFISVSDFIF